MTTISAQGILRSRNAAGGGEHILSTLLLTYPRFIHAEFMTHRLFSRNAASSRAIPFEKQLAALLADPAVPLHWGAHQKGMQANTELDGNALAMAQLAWQEAMEAAVHHARAMHEAGAHKQIVNRIIEPYTHIKVLVSATEWDNFLDLRNHPAAEPHMQILARAIQEVLETFPVQDLRPGQWHLPFVGGPEVYEEMWKQDALALCVARCASTSYKTVDDFDMTLDRARPLHDQFLNSRPQHASPLEHAAQADARNPSGNNGHGLWENPEQHANFVGFRQYRHNAHD